MLAGRTSLMFARSCKRGINVSARANGSMAPAEPYAYQLDQSSVHIHAESVRGGLVSLVRPTPSRNLSPSLL